MTSTSVRNVLVAGGDVMRYDENAKNLLSEKIVLAWIIKNVVTEAAEISIREIEIVDSNYQDMKKVYSIWICMNAPDYIGNAITRYDLGKKDVVGETPDHVEDYDKINVSMIYLNQKKDSDDDSIFHFLNTLLSEAYSVDEKMRVLEEKFAVGISEETGLRKELNTMCNLGEGLVKRSEKCGEERGEKRGVKLGEERMQDRLNELIQRLFRENRIEDLKRASEDKVYQKELMEEYQIS